MSIAASVKSVSPVARSLTDGGRMVVVKSEFAPITEVARSLHNPVRANSRAFCTRVAMESEDQVAQANEVIVGADQAAVEDQVEVLTKAVNTMVFTARNVIVPTVDALTSQFLAKQSDAGQANVSINVFKYHDVHSEPSLVNHVASKYTNVQPRSSYRTFLLGSRPAETIVTLVSENNPHLDPSQVVEWLLEMGAERIVAVWNKLFATAREFDFTNASWMKSSNWPIQIDELALAYCCTGALLETPQDVTGESVSLEEWNRHLGLLHELIGQKLLQAYTYRAEDAKSQRLVLVTDGKDGIRTGVVSVLVNGDVYSGWLNAGGDVQALLGLAVYEPNLKAIPQINAQAEALAKRWMTYYPVLRQACADNCIRNRRRDLASIILGSTLAVEGLPQMDQGVVSQRLDAELRALDDEAYNRPFNLIAELVCRIYYPQQPLYVGFLRSMERYAKIYPEATGRELAIEAVIELVATFQADQITTIDFTPEVDPNAVSQEDTAGANVVIDPANDGIAEGITETGDDGPTDEVAEAEAAGETIEDGEVVDPDVVLPSEELVPTGDEVSNEPETDESKDDVQ